jgi:hypothetical protein
VSAVDPGKHVLRVDARCLPGRCRLEVRESV